jgi:hypothetical protein
MVAYSFQKLFVPMIRSGRKAHTIRADRMGRSRHARPGERLQLYTALRTVHCQLIGTATCSAVEPVRLQPLPVAGFVQLNSTWLTARAELNDFAWADGFHDWEELCAFWKRHHPGISIFSGVIIRWRDFAEGRQAA